MRQFNDHAPSVGDTRHNMVISQIKNYISACPTITGHFKKIFQEFFTIIKIKIDAFDESNKILKINL